jgi:hypothetical protein
MVTHAKIEVSGWYVVQTKSGAVYSRHLESGSERRQEIVDGPFSHWRDACNAAASIPR